jgi:hypothetical protein
MEGELGYGRYAEIGEHDLERSEIFDEYVVRFYVAVYNVSEMYLAQALVKPEDEFSYEFFRGGGIGFQVFAKRAAAGEFLYFVKPAFAGFAGFDNVYNGGPGKRF